MDNNGLKLKKILFKCQNFGTRFEDIINADAGNEMK